MENSILPWEIPPLNAPRNIHVFSGNGSYLGGLYLNEPSHITNGDFYAFCEHFLLFPSANYRWRLHGLEPGNALQLHEYVPRDCSTLTPGRYVALGDDSKVIEISVSDERPVRRIPTCLPSTSRLSPNQLHFRNALRVRDQCCAITGTSSPEVAPFLALHAVHIFPAARHEIWTANGFQRWITDSTDQTLISPNGLFSAQNGLLLSSQARVYFDAFLITVDPDNDYKIIPLAEDILQVGGRILSPTTRPDDNPNMRISDDALRWHLHQSILTHVRGTGETFWDLDAAGGDYMGMIMDEPDAAEIMEIEMGNRLAAHIQDEESSRHSEE